MENSSPGRKEWIDAYRFGYGYHPFHAFSMISCGHIAEMHTSAVYIVGGQEPGFARGMGMKTRATFEEALKDAGKYTGDNPAILASTENLQDGRCSSDDEIDWTGRSVK